jgi:hypothetical protein
MFLAAGRIAERDHLAGGQVANGKLGPCDDGRRLCRSSTGDRRWLDGDAVIIFDQPQGRKQPGQPRQCKRRSGAIGTLNGNCVKRTDRTSIEIAGRIRKRPSRIASPAPS